MAREIFKDPLPDRIENRPLGRVSDFVQNLLPVTLEEIRTYKSAGILTDLANHVEVMFENFDYGVLIKDGNLDSEALFLSRLDLLMLDGGIAHSSAILESTGALQQPIEPGPKFKSVLEKIVMLSGMPAHLTYEDIVLNNPTNDKRVFTNGRIGQSEADFYEGHLLIEHELEKGIVLLRDAFEEASNNPLSPVVAEALNQSQNSLKFLVEYTGRIGRDMSIEDFKYFRAYLQSHPRNGLSGPSGQFTARVPLTEVLLVGDRLGSGHSDYFDKYRQYFPVDGMKQIDNYFQRSVNEGSLLTKLQKAGNPELNKLILANLKLIMQFRNAHMKATKRQLLDGITGPVRGTSGVSDIEVFLRGRIDKFQTIIDSSFSNHLQNE